MKLISSHKIYLFLLVFICSLFFYFSYAKFGMFFVDTSRETYIPMMMNKGAVLYKDIFNIFTPLAYQINAFFCKIFGENLKTFYFLGFFNSIIFISGIFSIGCLFLKDSKFSCFLFSIFIIASCIFAVSPSNYILPYSYSIVYAISAIVWSLFFLLFYIKNKSTNSLIWAFFLFGVCLSCKYDFIFFIFVLFPSLFNKDLKLSIKIYSLIAFLTAPFLSFLSLFIQGVTLSDLKEAIYYITMLMKSNASIICYKFLGVIPTFNSLKLSVLSFFKTMPIICLIVFIFQKIFQSGFKYRFLCITALFVTIIYFLNPIFYISNAFYFNWIGIFVIFLFLIFLYYLKKKENIETTDKMFFVLFISAILISIKGITSINLNNYGTYYLPFLSLCAFLYFYHYKNNYKFGLTILLIILFSIYAFSNIDRREIAFNTEVKTQKGVIYTDKNAAIAINQAIKYIEKNTTSKDKILVLPEGAMINFLTDRISDNKYFYLIPANIEVFGEENIVKDLKANLPDYIILQPMSFNNFGETYFCESFGGKICSLLPEYYESPIVFGSDFWIALYKHKKIR